MSWIAVSSLWSLPTIAGGVPAGTPPAIVARLHKELTAIQDTPELKKQFAHEGADIVRMTSAEYGSFIASETARWGRVVKEAGLKPQ